MIKVFVLFACLAGCLSTTVHSQTGRYDTMTLEEKVVAGAGYHDDSAEVIEPFRILGNIYYVGAADVSSYLITTSEGHFL
ncbi:MAG: hypothetical protein WBJ75_04185, partial [Pseudohongiellaceae bacterium]